MNWRKPKSEVGQKWHWWLYLHFPQLLPSRIWSIARPWSAWGIVNKEGIIQGEQSGANTTSKILLIQLFKSLEIGCWLVSDVNPNVCVTLQSQPQPFWINQIILFIWSGIHFNSSLDLSHTLLITLCAKPRSWGNCHSSMVPQWLDDSWTARQGEEWGGGEAVPSPGKRWPCVQRESGTELCLF